MRLLHLSRRIATVCQNHVFRNATAKEIDLFTQRTIREGWHIGPYDYQCGLAFDPKGFFVQVIKLTMNLFQRSVRSDIQTVTPFLVVTLSQTKRSRIHHFGSDKRLGVLWSQLHSWLRCCSISDACTAEKKASSHFVTLMSLNSVHRTSQNNLLP